jgi:hypothetical protein
MEKMEARREVLVAELAALDAGATLLEDKTVLKEIAAQAADIRKLLREYVSHARQMLRKLEGCEWWWNGSVRRGCATPSRARMPGCWG